MVKKKAHKDWFVKNHLDTPFVILMGILLVVGLVMLLSASYIYAFHGTADADSFHYFRKQAIIALVLFLAVTLLFSRINYKYYRYWTNLFLVLSLAMVGLTVITGGGDGVNRWFEIGGIQFQPSEFAKVAIILFCASGLDKDHKKIVSTAPSKVFWAVKLREISKGAINFTEGTVTMMFYLAVIGITSVMVLMGSHLSGAILIALIGITMLWMGECRARWFAVGGVIVLAVFLFVYFDYEQLPLKEYMIERIKAWRIKDFSPDDARWQINHSLFALGSGGLLGAGLGNSKQKYLYVSESHTDFIFSIIGEELGFVGCVLILILFILLICRGIYIGMRARDRYGALLAFGMSAQLAIQVIFNVAVVTDTVPNTGISLPFFSYGGTALLITLAEMGVILAVSRQANLPKVYSMRKEKKSADKSVDAE